MLIRSNRAPLWTNFYGVIEGFNYEPGYEYHLEVKRTKLKNRPADASAYKYELVNLLKKEKKESDLRQEFKKPTFEGIWNLKELNKKQVTKYNATIVFDTQSNFNANSGCNSTTKIPYTKGNNNEIILKKDSHIATTLKGCPNGHIENEYFKTLREIKKYEASEHLLKFYNKTGKVILVFKR